MNLLLYVLATAGCLACRQAPVGAQLHIRLTSAIGSYGSRVGAPIRAVVIAPVVVNGETAVPAGSVLAGRVKSARRVGYGIVRETAAIGLEFNTLILPDHRRLTISSQLAQVDNSRERVGRDGVIHGVRSTGSLCYRVSGYIRTALQWEVHADIAVWLIKTLLVQVPEPEIYYPAGVEMTLSLTKPLMYPAPEEDDETTPHLTRVERVNIEPLVEQLPNRSFAVSSRPSDLVNVLFIGSRKQLSGAFAAAGWEEPHPPSMRSRLAQIRAASEGLGYRHAEMSSLLVNEMAPDMAWEKGFNDLSKRHHIRLWKQPESWHGQELWVGAATRDVDYAYFRPGQALTHRVQKDIDQERDKIVNDLAFTSCVESVDWLDRTGVPRSTHNSTGDPMTTDARLAVVRLNECSAPRLSTESTDDLPLPAHGGMLQRFVRREILSMKSDLIRTNTYYRAYEGVRWVIEAAIRKHRRHKLEQVPAVPAVILERAQNLEAKPAS
jgi:hypothetical protein